MIERKNNSLLIDTDPLPSAKANRKIISRSNPLFTHLQEKDYYEVVSLSSGYFSTYKRGGKIIHQSYLTILI